MKTRITQTVFLLLLQVCCLQPLHAQTDAARSEHQTPILRRRAVQRLAPQTKAETLRKQAPIVLTVPLRSDSPSLPGKTSPLVMPSPGGSKTPARTVQSVFLTDRNKTESIRVVAGRDDAETPDAQAADPRASEIGTSTALVPQNAEPMPAAKPDSPGVEAFPGRDVLVPIKPEPVPEDVRMQDDKGLLTLIATDAELPGVLRTIATHHNYNLVLGPGVDGPVSVSIKGATFDEVMDAILGVAGFNWNLTNKMLYVTSSSGENANGVGLNPRIQGRFVKVYRLDYVAASDVETVVTRLLSPIGSSFISEGKEDDQLRTREIVIVEDTAEAHIRIEQYIAQIDVPPRQVLVEAHILQVALDDSDRHGINLRTLADFEGAGLSLDGTGFAETDAEGPSLALRVDGTDMDALIELIQQNTNSRTLASPKVSVVNHQEAKIQIGQRLPYSVATTTQTSTVQNIQFLEVGIVLTVRPIITDDNNVLMSVSPKVSGGRITENGFPEEDTTEVSTTILMPDGGGIVIGGLIREEDTQTRASVPGLCRIPVVGKLFTRKSNETRRDELVVALVTHVLPDVYGARSHEIKELQTTLPFHSQQELRHPQMHDSTYQTRLPIPSQPTPAHAAPGRTLPSLESFRNSAANPTSKMR